MSTFLLGDLILVSKPYAYVLDNSIRGKRCDNCFKKNDNLKRCSQCSFLYFCDKHCQAEMWPSHKTECKLIKKANPEEPTSFLRLFTLVLLKIKKYGLDDPWENIYGRRVSFGTLMSHVSEIKKDLKRCQQMMALFGTLKQYLDESNIPPISELIEIFGKMCINTFSIADGEMESIGCGVYLGASVFDHSCQPDAEVVFDGINLNIRAVHNIPHQDISKIFISYVEQLQIFQNRREYLKEHYYFECKCPRCTTPYYDEMMSKLIVDEAEAKEFLKKCEVKIKNIKQMKKDKVSARIIYEACWKELEELSKIVADTHIFKITVLELTFDAALETSNWVEALAVGRELIEPYKFFWGPYYPLLGIHLFKIGKIENILNSFQSAKEHFMEAEKILKVTHGENHRLYSDLLKCYNSVKF